MGGVVVKIDTKRIVKTSSTFAKQTEVNMSMDPLSSTNYFIYGIGNTLRNTVMQGEPII